MQTITTLDIGTISPSACLLAHALGVGDSLPKTKNAAQSITRVIDAALVSPQELYDDLDWEVFVPPNFLIGQRKFTRKGMTSFPRNPNGTYNPEIVTPYGETVKAGNYIAKWISLCADRT
jgi:hypothetical protein